MSGTVSTVAAAPRWPLTATRMTRGREKMQIATCRIPIPNPSGGAGSLLAVAGGQSVARSYYNYSADGLLTGLVHHEGQTIFAGYRWVKIKGSGVFVFDKSERY